MLSALLTGVMNSRSEARNFAKKFAPPAHPFIAIGRSRPVCVHHSSAGCIPNLDFTVLHKNEHAGDDNDAMNVQVEMDHRCLSRVHYGNGTAAKASAVLKAKAQTKYFTAEEVHY